MASIIARGVRPVKRGSQGIEHKAARYLWGVTLLLPPLPRYFGLKRHLGIVLNIADQLP
jgi:hypothetical protein